MPWCRSTCILGRPLPDAYINDQLLCLAGGRFAVVDITATPRPFSIRQHLGTHSMHNGGQLWLVTRVEEYCFATAGLLRTRAKARTQTLTGPRQLWMEGCSMGPGPSAKGGFAEDEGGVPFGEAPP